MPVKAPPFKLFFEIIFLESYAGLGTTGKSPLIRQSKAWLITPDTPRSIFTRLKMSKGNTPQERGMSISPTHRKNWDSHLNTGRRLGWLLLEIAAITTRVKERCSLGQYITSILPLSILKLYRALGSESLPHEFLATGRGMQTIIIRDANKALHFVFPGTFTDLTWVKSRFNPFSSLLVLIFNQLWQNRAVVLNSSLISNYGDDLNEKSIHKKHNWNSQ